MAANPAIVKYTDAVNAKFGEIETGVDQLVTSQDGVSKDVTFLKDTITKLQNTPGTLNAEDTELLNAAETRANALAVKTTAVSAALKALDEATAQEEVPEPPVV